MPATPSSRPEDPDPPDATRERLEALGAPAYAVPGLNAAAAAAATPPRVLVVDDSPVNRRFAEALVERRGLAVASAENGSAALERLAEEPFDLVLLDGMMPGLDGPAVAREVRRREAAAGLDPIPIVALTASFLPEDRDRMLEAGMDDHLAKPYTAEDLGQVLDRRLATGRRRSRPIPASVARPAVAAAVDGAPVLDLDAFARFAELGDATFVERIVRLSLADAAERVAQVDAAIEGHDAPRLRAALHALEGICGNVGAAALDRRTRAIHDELRRREDRGEDPFGPGLGPSGLEPLLDATRIRLQEQAAAAARRDGQGSHGHGGGSDGPGRVTATRTPSDPPHGGR